MSEKYHEYLGDAVYAQYDGYHIVLTTEHHEIAQANNAIYLDADVIQNLNRYVEKIIATVQEDNRE